MAVAVTLQLNVGLDEAGDWATRSTGSAGNATANAEVVTAFRDEVLIRIHNVRGAVDAMRDTPYGSTLAETQSSPADIGYGEPVMYQGMSFLVRTNG